MGCSGSYPGPDSPASCYLVRAEDEAGRTWRILLDLGSGALGALQRYDDPLRVDAVFLSHLHADHCLDLCGYYVLRRYHPAGPRPRIPVYGPEGIAARMARAYDLPPEPGMTGEFDFVEYAGPVQVGPFRVEPLRVAHPGESFALRVSAGGRTLAYSGDTGPCAGLRATAADAHLFLAEASFAEGDPNPPDVHLTGAQAGTMASQARAGRLLLTHVPPWHDPQAALKQARTAYDGPLELAVPGGRYAV